MQEKTYLYLSFGISVVSIIIIAIAKPNLPPVVPIFFGLPVGAEQLASVWWLEVAPISSLLITLLNLTIVRFLKDDFLRQILVFSSFFVSLLVATTLIKIILLVGFI